MIKPTNEIVDTEVILVFRDINANGTVNLFSVALPSQPSVKARAIVRHEGDDRGGGSWTCLKDGTQLCGHIKRARDHLQKLVREDPDAADRSEYRQAIDTGMLKTERSLSSTDERLIRTSGSERCSCKAGNITYASPTTSLGHSFQ
jgi:hypothetical protein